MPWLNSVGTFIFINTMKQNPAMCTVRVHKRTNAQSFKYDVEYATSAFSALSKSAFRTSPLNRGLKSGISEPSRWGKFLKSGSASVRYWYMRTVFSEISSRCDAEYAALETTSLSKSAF